MPPKARFSKLKAWSYSVYTQYNNCPFSVCLDKIVRVRMPETKSPGMERGTMVHKAAEEYVSGTGRAPKLIEELEKFKEHFTDFRKAGASVEGEWAFTAKYGVTGWFDDDCWLRVKVDACKAVAAPTPIVHIVDYKTGRVYPEHKQQRSLYALAGLQLVKLGRLLNGDVKVQLTASHLYTDTGQTATERYTMAQLEPLKREWGDRTKQMLNDTVFPTKTGRHCAWCKHAKSKGGSCPENR